MVRRRCFCKSFSAIVTVTTLVLIGACSNEIAKPVDESDIASVVMLVAWPPNAGLGRATAIPGDATDIGLRISKESDDPSDGVSASITRPDTMISIEVLAGSGYQVEAVCARQMTILSHQYTPIGYGITKGVTLQPGITNYVTVEIDTFILSIDMPDTIAVGDTLSVEINFEIGKYLDDVLMHAELPYWLVKQARESVDGDLSYSSIQFTESTRDSTSITFQLSNPRVWSTPTELRLFDATAEVDAPAGSFLQFRNFGLSLSPAYRPSDFGCSGDWLTIQILGGTTTLAIIIT